jgi:hypothetical protein
VSSSPQAARHPVRTNPYSILFPEQTFYRNTIASLKAT